MLRLSIYLICVTLGLPAMAGTTDHALLRDFAACAGRYAAQVDWARSRDPQTAGRSRTRTDTFDQLVEALLPDATAQGLSDQRVRHWRRDAKSAQFDLLLFISYGIDPDHVVPAETTAARYLRICDDMILSE